MKQKVNYSTGAFILSVLTLAIMIGAGVYLLKWVNPVAAWIVLGVMVLMSVVSLFYSPISVEITDNDLLINFSMRTKRIPLEDIASAVRFDPNAGLSVRICGSGGFMGWWGWFNNKKIGRYFAYFADPSRCILLRLKSHRRYVISCADPDALIGRLS